jgi:LPS sulfotransferase NodH
MPQHTSYLICTTPRSGSWLLAEALTGTGLAGRPQDYFWHADEQTHRRQLGVPADAPFADYFRKVVEYATTPNGVCGVKMMSGNLEYFVGFAQALVGTQHVPVPELLATLFPNLHYIWLKRNDKVRQAISWVRASQTGVYMITDDTQRPTGAQVSFDFDVIAREVRAFEREEAFWGQYFATCGVEPLTVVYEDFASAYEETALRILDHLGVATQEPVKFAPRRLMKQADALSDEWVRWYHQLEAPQRPSSTQSERKPGSAKNT